MGEYKFSLRQARSYKGLSQKDVARELHKTPQTIVNWEKGLTPINISEFQMLSRLYEIPEEDIFLPEISSKTLASG